MPKKRPFCRTYYADETDSSDSDYVGISEGRHSDSSSAIGYGPVRPQHRRIRRSSPQAKISGGAIEKGRETRSGSSFSDGTLDLVSTQGTATQEVKNSLKTVFAHLSRKEQRTYKWQQCRLIAERLEHWLSRQEQLDSRMAVYQWLQYYHHFSYDLLPIIGIDLFCSVGLAQEPNNSVAQDCFAIFGQYVTKTRESLPYVSSVWDHCQKARKAYNSRRSKIQAKMPFNVQILFADINSSIQMCKRYEGKLVALNDIQPYQTQGIPQLPIERSSTDDHFFLREPLKEPGISMIAVVDNALVPDALRKKILENAQSIELALLEKHNYLEADWLLVLAVYGAFDRVDLVENITRQVEEELRARKQSKRNSKIQLGRSVSAAQAHADQHGNVIRPRNYSSRQTVSDTNLHNQNIQDIWDYVLCSLDATIPQWVSNMRARLSAKGYQLRGLSDFLCCGYLLSSYTASIHRDRYDPKHTVGIRIDRLQSETDAEYQLFFPELNIKGKQGLIVEQSAGAITLYQGGKLLHSNSVGSATNYQKGCAPGLALVQKVGLFGNRRIEHDLLRDHCLQDSYTEWAQFSGSRFLI